MHKCNHRVSDHCDNLGFVKMFFLNPEHEKVIGKEAAGKWIEKLGAVQEAMILIEEAANQLN